MLAYPAHRPARVGTRKARAAALARAIRACGVQRALGCVITSGCSAWSPPCPKLCGSCSALGLRRQRAEAPARRRATLPGRQKRRRHRASPRRNQELGRPRLV